MFAYCLNNPVNGADPSGLRPWYIDGDGNPIEVFSPAPINGQGRAKYRYLSYGISTVGHAGCEAIAVYNALAIIGYHISFEEIKAFFEELLRGGCGWGLKGAWGVTPLEVWSALCYYHVKNEGGGLFQYDKFSKPDSPTIMIVSFWNKPIWFLTPLKLTAVFPPMAASAWAISEVGMNTKGIPRFQVAAAKPPRSQTMPPPTHSSRLLRNILFSNSAFHTKWSVSMFLFSSPAGMQIICLSSILPHSFCSSGRQWWRVFVSQSTR